MKNLFLAFAVIIFSSIAGFSQNEDEPKIVLPPLVTALGLSHNKISSRCGEAEPSCAANTTVKISTTAHQVDNSQYVYTVTGGKVTGTGANVTWDLSGVEPGEYTITAGITVPTWGVIGQTQTKRVTVVDLAAQVVTKNPCARSVLVKASFSSIKVGDVVKFVVTAEGDGEKLFYKWNISGGKIIGENNSWELLVKATPDTAGNNITAVANVYLDPSGSCDNGASETVVVVK